MDENTPKGPELGGALTIHTDDALPGVLELRASGLILLPALRAVHREIAALRARRKDLRVLLFDASAVERFGRGAVVEAARFTTRNARSFDMAVTVTHSPSLKSAALALAACAPSLRHVVVADRNAAIELLRARPAVAMTG